MNPHGGASSAVHQREELGEPARKIARSYNVSHSR
jgi:hypothetical protein